MTGTGGTAISVLNCAKTFDDGTRAVIPTDLEIAAGETIVFLGPSGCGKTTTLRMIAGLEQPDPGGRILFNGEDVTSLPIERRNIGMVFQSYALFPNMTVLDNVAYGLRVRGIGRDERHGRANEIMEMMHISDLGARRVDQLSGGQRQRVALARALAVRPRALLLDEPLTALDAALREYLRAEIDALLRQLAITAVYVTHDQAEALALADRIAVMSKGKIVQIGPPRDIYFKPVSTFVADFVGITNRIAGSVSAGWFECAAGRFQISAPDCASAWLAFRPEAARIAPAAEASLQFTVDRAHFLGSRQKVYLCASDGASAQIEADNRVNLSSGTVVGLHLEPTDVAIIPAPEGSP